MPESRPPGGAHKSLERELLDVGVLLRARERAARSPDHTRCVASCDSSKSIKAKVRKVEVQMWGSFGDHELASPRTSAQILRTSRPSTITGKRHTIVIAL